MSVDVHQCGEVSVLVPAYNEERTVGLVLDRLLALRSICLKEVVVVDDGSSDGTRRIVEGRAAHDPRVRLFVQPSNRGKTQAIARAIAESRGEILIVQDADLEYDPAEIASVIAPIVDDRADVVYGSRFLIPQPSERRYTGHYLGNRLITWLSNLLTGRKLSDVETCYKAFRAGVIRPLALTSRRFGMEVEITAMVCKTRARLCEVPISYQGRSHAEGKKIGVRDGLQALYYLGYYHLSGSLGQAGRNYIKTVNRYLAERTAQSATASVHEAHAWPPGGPGTASAPRPCPSDRHAMSVMHRNL